MLTISVIMTTAPYGRNLEDAIKSILNQTYRDFEFLILNNSSNREISLILKKFKDKRIRIIDLPQMNIAQALNRGVHEGKSIYIARMEADDLSAPDRFEKQLALLESSPGTGMAASWYRLIEKGKVINTFELERDHENIMRHILHREYFTPGSVIFRRDCVEAAWGYDRSLNFLPDYDLCLKIGRNRQLATVGEFLHQVKPRWRQGFSTNFKKKKQAELKKIKTSYLKSIPERDKLFGQVRESLTSYPLDNILYEEFKRLLPHYENIENRYFYSILSCVREPENSEYFNELTKIYETRRNKTLAFRSALRSLDNNPRQPEVYQKVKKYLKKSRSCRHPEISLKPCTGAVSVIMPTYNRGETIQESIESVLNQTFQDLELIIINDGGSDKIEKIISSYNSPKIKYLKIKHKGLAGALNAGLSQAGGKYISYLDDDDIYYPNHLERLFNLLERSETSLAYSKSLVVKGHYNQNKFVKEKVAGTFTKGAAHQKISHGCFISTLNVMHLKQALKKTGAFNEELPWSMDWDLWTRFAQYFDFNFLDEFTGEYRKTNLNMSIRERV